MDDLSQKLIKEHSLTLEEYRELLQNWEDPEVSEGLAKEALKIRRENYGNDIYIRGLIEFTNICKNDCFYCGIRKSNPDPERYRLKKKEILSVCENGYKLGFRTFVLQGGDDPYYTDEVLTEIIREIRKRYPDCAISLSVGERSFEAYEMFREAGADRYLLREETANEKHYRKLHPDELSLQSRMNCLFDLKSLGYQVGAGFMVGSPYQKLDYIAEDLWFLQELQPEMVGIGPFIPHHDTSFADYPPGSVELTLFLLSVIRIVIPDVLLPATTALSTLDPDGRKKAMLAGANVLMPNITPLDQREHYEIYDDKVSAIDVTKEHLKELTETMEEAGFHIVYDRGDYKPSSHRKEKEAAVLDKDDEKHKKKKKKKKKNKDKKNKNKKDKKKDKEEKKEKKNG